MITCYPSECIDKKHKKVLICNVINVVIMFSVCVTVLVLSIVQRLPAVMIVVPASCAMIELICLLCEATDLLTVGKTTHFYVVPVRRGEAMPEGSRYIKRLDKDKVIIRVRDLSEEDFTV